jgi:UDP-N-acetylmuramate--alanine ligase
MSVHFSGIAGKGLAPAASLALQAGLRVTGHDLVENHRIPLLRDAGADITVGHHYLTGDALTT